MSRPAITRVGGARRSQLETGHTLLVTDAEDALSWERAEHAGWGVGLYEHGEHTDGATAYGQVDDGGSAALLPRRAVAS